MLYDIELTPEALKAAAEWAESGPGVAAVQLVVDDRMLVVSQGDERASFDTDGSRGSDEYTALAPLDRPDLADFTPPENLADAWRRFQAGEDVEPWELRKLDEARADWREDILG